MQQANPMQSGELDNRHGKQLESIVRVLLAGRFHALPATLQRWYRVRNHSVGGLQGNTGRPSRCDDHGVAYDDVVRQRNARCLHWPGLEVHQDLDDVGAGDLLWCSEVGLRIE